MDHERSASSRSGSSFATRWIRGRLGLMVLTIDSLAARALVHSTPGGAVLQAGTGMLVGIAQIAIVGWIQRRVELEMMGRSMSVLMFTFMGLGPLSAAVAGSPAEGDLAARAVRRRWPAADRDRTQLHVQSGAAEHWGGAGGGGARPPIGERLHAMLFRWKFCAGSTLAPANQLG